MAGHQPVRVVPGGEFEQGEAQLLDGLELAHPEQVLLQGPDEPLGDAVALWLAHEGRRRLDAEEGDLVLEVIGHVVRARSWRSLRPAATSLPRTPKCRRTPWCTGSRACKR